MTKKKRFHDKDIPSEYARNRQHEEERTEGLTKTIRANRTTHRDVQRGYAAAGLIPFEIGPNTILYIRPDADKEKIRAKYLKSII